MIMLSLRPSNRYVLSTFIRQQSQSVAVQESEYTKTPQYPPILDIRPEKKLERKKESEYEALRHVKTVEEKQIKLNMPRYYGFKCYLLKEDSVPYNNLTLAQYATRTHLIQSDELPLHYTKLGVQYDLNKLKNDVEETVLIELEGYRRMNDLKKTDLSKIEQENLISSSISKQINRLLMNNLPYSHLKETTVDVDSRIESVWLAGGMHPPKAVKSMRDGCSWMKDKVDDPIDRLMYYIGSANVALRTDKPLPYIVPYAESENPALTVPVFEYDPRTVGIATDYKHIANIPGFWPGDSKQFGFLSYHKRGHMYKRSYNDPQDDKEAIHRQGILASFSWLNAQANFLGFNFNNDITYPLVTQTIITNGQIWSFYVYQLNTIVNHGKYQHQNPRNNICWATSEMKLYQEIQDGKLVGFNDEILKTLVHFYANSPQERLGLNMRPYLSETEKLAADYKDDEKREWLEKEYKFLVSNRPRWKLTPEIYAWEKIYKIDNKTRPMERKRRPFEFGINPFKRTLDARKPKYIPRALRPDLPKNKGRDAKEFFP